MDDNAFLAALPAKERVALARRAGRFVGRNMPHHAEGRVFSGAPFDRLPARRQPARAHLLRVAKGCAAFARNHAADLKTDVRTPTQGADP